MSIDIGKLLQDAERRMAQGGKGSGFDFGSLFKQGAIAEQLLVWSVLSQLIGTVLTPPLQELLRGVYSELQSAPLTPAELAVMVVRHIVGDQDATNYAKQSGIAPSDFERMVHVAGQGPGPAALAEALRRGIIEATGTGAASTSFEQGIAESDLKDKWTDTVKQLAVLEPTPADALDALLQGQLPEDQARSLYALFGGDPKHFTWLFNTRGSAPTPVELGVMAQRGIIPWDGTGPGAVSFDQGFLEGPWRDKWSDAFRQLAEYRPPPRTIVAMLRAGSLSDERGLQLLRQSGLSDELARDYIADAHLQKTQTQHDLALSQIGALYKDRLIDRAEAGLMLSALRYSTQSQAFLLDLWDFDALQVKVRSAVNKVHNLYVAHKIDAARASSTLDGLGVPPAGRDEMLTIWNLEREANVQQLTAAEIADAVYYDIIDFEQGVARLVALGWPQDDALLRIGIRLHGKPPPAPKA